MRCSVVQDHSLDSGLPRARRRLMPGEVCQQALDFLCAFGHEPDAIAARLARDGARGIARDSSRCVLASYLAVLLPAEPRIAGVAVGNARLVIRLSRWLPRKQTVELLEAIQCLVRAFDQHAYPELEYREGAGAR
ncbi:MAG: hypothetical protein M0004_13145 [Actinomycetota bacterium]|nr:hypothetical protein [Actinomycetota bacterium]